MADPEQVDLDPERQRYVLDVFARLGTISLYEILGVPRDSNARAIKRAYFDLSKVIHPDRYFGKQLGSFKPKLEAIFARTTLAYETLSDAEARAAYDATLPAAPASAPPLPAPAARGPAPASAPPPPPPRPAAPVDAGVAERKKAALDALMAHVGRSRDQAKPRAEEAARALAAGDLEAAVAAYRDALRLTPNDAALRQAAEKAERSLAARRLEADRRQAMLEERHGHWARAAASWRRVVAASPDDAEARARLAAAAARAAEPPGDPRGNVK